MSLVNEKTLGKYIGKVTFLKKKQLKRILAAISTQSFICWLLSSEKCVFEQVFTITWGSVPHRDFIIT